MSGKVHLSTSGFDKALEPKASKYYKLSIQLSLDGFSFCIYDKSRNKYSGLEVYAFQDVSNYIVLNALLKDLIPKIEWLKNEFEQTAIIFETPVSTFIPEPLFDKQHINDYLKFNHTVEIDYTIKNDYLPLLDAENIWALPLNIFTTLSASFPQANIYHHASSLIETLLMHNKNLGAEEIVFVNVRKNWLDMVVLKGNGLLFFNSFQYKSKEDFIYYLIYVLEQLNLNPEKIDVTLIGEIDKISSVYEMTFKYVRNISFGRRNNSYNYSYVFDEIPGHFYFNLIHLQQCGL